VASHVGKPEGEARCGAYPEETDYKDTGCDLHPACLTCPFEYCRYDKHTTRPQNIGLVAFEKYRVDNQQARQLRREGMTVQRISEHLNISKRTVLRWFAVQRKEEGKAA
jgi:transposase-like protein